jgi:hypothetical protein
MTCLLLLRGSASDGPRGDSNDDRWKLGGLRSLVAAVPMSMPFHGADGADALQGDRPAMARAVTAAMIAVGLEGYGPS